MLNVGTDNATLIVPEPERSQAAGVCTANSSLPDDVGGQHETDRSGTAPHRAPQHL
ncbi:protein of unknown function [Streptantibioticus cattleyicolor NRRL 8057 = DSM 46488]|nr:protein of unknown function [Streptantibioticus cattleyicolor NRRL 8057 = DSM 46488]